MRDIEPNLTFLLVEVERQIREARDVLENHDEKAIDKIEARDDYIDNLKSVIENACFGALHETVKPDAQQVAYIRALHIIANNLERIGDHAVNVVRQTRHYGDPERIRNYGYKPFFNEILMAMEWIPPAAMERDLSSALKICRSELHLDRLYKREFDRIRGELRTGMFTGDLLTTLFIFRYLERIGDALLNVGEAAIFGITGDKFKIRQFRALNDILAASGNENPLSDLDFESIWGTRSGCRIGRVHDRHPGGPNGRDVIFKEGDTDKLCRENANIDRWEALMPGLPPRVEAFRENGKTSSMLVTMLPGQTIQDIALAGDAPLLRSAMATLRRTAASLWEKTLRPGEVSAGSVRQLRQRLPDVLSVHPRFDLPQRTIGLRAIPSLAELIEQAETVEKRLASPFSVLIHGDYNSNNILYDPAEDRIHYIDLHRSAHADLVQDVAVYMISHFRLPVFDEPRRKMLLTAILDMYAFARTFATDHGDAVFDLRLTLGLARSLITSTRFELSQRFSRLMFQRGVYLLEHAIDHAGDPATFRLPLAAMRH